MMNNSTEDFSEYHQDFDLLIMILTSFILGLMILTTIIGNVFVMAAILTDRHLQSVANYLILSLALADLLVAILVMPLGAFNEINKSWILGPVLCDIWTSSDVFCCTASILHLLAIALGEKEFWAVTYPHYIHTRSSSSIWMLISCVWLMSVIVSLAPLFGWKDEAWLARVNEGACMVSQEISYQIFATSATFFVPLILILLLYWRIFITARKRLRNRLALKTYLPKPSNICADGESKNSRAFQTQVIICTGNASVATTSFSSAVIASHPSTAQQEEGEAGKSCPTNNNCDRHGESRGEGESSHTQTQEDLQPLHSHSPQKKVNQKKKKKHVSLEAKRERKAAKTLAIVTGAFIICWLPFFILGINNNFFLWLGYFNSTLNPIIYTVFSPEFRQAFKRILCGRNTPDNYRPRHLQ